LLDEIPGVDWTTAAAIIAELGMDMSVFQNVLQAASRVAVGSGNHESAGKRKSSRIPKGNVYLKTALVEAATAATKKHSLTRNVVHRLERLGYAVTLEQKGRMNSVALAYAGCPAEPYFDSSRSCGRMTTWVLEVMYEDALWPHRKCNSPYFSNDTKTPGLEPVVISGHGGWKVGSYLRVQFPKR